MEKRKAIDKLEEVLNFLKSTQVTDEDVLLHLKEPLDDLRSSVKYIPIKPYFDIIPTEIETKILNELCDSNAFIAAAVCLEWKQILGGRFTDKTVTIGRSCCSSKCADHYKCYASWRSSSEMLKALATHKLDVRLVIRHSVREVDSKLLTDGMTTVSRFSITGTCSCNDSETEEWKNESYEPNSIDGCEVNPMSDDQFEDLFKCLEKNVKTMEEVKLVCLDLTKLNQDRLVHCFVNKIQNLTLRESEDHHEKMFSFKTLVNKLSQESGEFKLNKLTLEILDDPNGFPLELGKALCNVENVKLCENMPLMWATVTQLVENIVSDTRQVKIKTLIMQQFMDFRPLTNPEDLKKLCNKMINVQLEGDFTLEQVEAARSLPDVNVGEDYIEKGSDVFE